MRIIRVRIYRQCNGLADIYLCTSAGIIYVLLKDGNYDDEPSLGPQYAFLDVNFSDMNISGTGTVSGGMIFHIRGTIKGYNEEGMHIELESVSIAAR